MTQKLRFLLLTFLNIGLTAAGAPGAPQTPRAAPAFSLPDLFQNHAVDLHEFQGKVVLVDFWASWCPPCRKTLPELGHIRGRHPSIAVLALSIDEERGKALNFLKPRDTSLIYLHDAKRKVAEQFDLGGMPSAYVIDRKGLIRFRHDGYGEADLRKIEDEIGKLLEEKP